MLKLSLISLALPGRLMVGQRTLDPLIGVRIPAGQPVPIVSTQTFTLKIAYRVLMRNILSNITIGKNFTKSRVRLKNLWNCYRTIFILVLFKNGNYCPTGGVEDGETPEESVIREVQEELSLDCEVVRLLFSVESSPGGNKDPYFLCRADSGAIVRNVSRPKYFKTSPSV